MPGRRLAALALATAALAAATAPAGAGKFDGKWSMTAVTTRGHCGSIPVGMSIKGGRISATGGSYAFYSIRLGGRVSDSGAASIRAVTGPRVANGSGRFKGGSASGTWSGKGPSGLCFGVWRASRG